MSAAAATVVGATVDFLPNTAEELERYAMVNFGAVIEGSSDSAILLVMSRALKRDPRVLLAILAMDDCVFDCPRQCLGGAFTPSDNALKYHRKLSNWKLRHVKCVPIDVARQVRVWLVSTLSMSLPIGIPVAPAPTVVVTSSAKKRGAPTVSAIPAKQQRLQTKNVKRKKGKGNGNCGGGGGSGGGVGGNSGGLRRMLKRYYNKYATKGGSGAAAVCGGRDITLNRMRIYDHDDEDLDALEIDYEDDMVMKEDEDDEDTELDVEDEENASGGGNVGDLDELEEQHKTTEVIGTNTVASFNSTLYAWQHSKRNTSGFGGAPLSWCGTDALPFHELPEEEEEPIHRRGGDEEDSDEYTRDAYSMYQYIRNIMTPRSPFSFPSRSLEAMQCILQYYEPPQPPPKEEAAAAVVVVARRPIKRRTRREYLQRQALKYVMKPTMATTL